jgi:predicted transcriptional regulator of viral defense system
MKAIEEYKKIFDQYGGMMRAKQLQAENILYRPLQKLIEQGCVEKVRYGYYQWVDYEDFSEVGTVIRLFPDAILCMDTALHHYGYSDRTPADWHLAVSKDSGKSRFKIDHPLVKPYYVEPSLLELGLTTGEIDGHEVRIYDKDRAICDCLRYRNKMDKEIFHKAIRSYIADPGKSVPKLLEYSQVLRVKKTAKDLIGVWL